MNLQGKLTRPSAVVLLAANSLPLFGVLLFDWAVFDIVFFYWAENVIIGGINVLRILATDAGSDAAEEIRPLRGLKVRNTGGGAKLFLAAFFAVHYGFFCWGHQQFLVSLFGDGRALGEVMSDPLIGIGLLAIAGSHLFSFFKNYLAGEENKRASAAQLMKRPYGRILVLHVTIIIGSFLVMLADSPVLLLVALIVIKTAVDLRQHDRERGLLSAGT